MIKIPTGFWKVTLKNWPNDLRYVATLKTRTEKHAVQVLLDFGQHVSLDPDLFTRSAFSEIGRTNSMTSPASPVVAAPNLTFC